jgi:hypothetical protein
MIRLIRNSKSQSVNSKSKYKGVKTTKEGNYQAMLVMSHKGKRMDICIGTYKTEKEAVKARIQYILKQL